MRLQTVCYRSRESAYEWRDGLCAALNLHFAGV
jgi:hypothetical protein